MNTTNELFATMRMYAPGAGAIGLAPLISAEAARDIAAFSALHPHLWVAACGGTALLTFLGGCSGGWVRRVTLMTAAILFAGLAVLPGLTGPTERDSTPGYEVAAPTPSPLPPKMAVAPPEPEPRESTIPELGVSAAAAPLMSIPAVTLNRVVLDHCAGTGGSVTGLLIAEPTGVFDPELTELVAGLLSAEGARPCTGWLTTDQLSAPVWAEWQAGRFRDDWLIAGLRPEAISRLWIGTVQYTHRSGGSPIRTHRTRYTLDLTCWDTVTGNLIDAITVSGDGVGFTAKQAATELHHLFPRQWKLARPNQENKEMTR